MVAQMTCATLAPNQVPVLAPVAAPVAASPAEDFWLVGIDPGAKGALAALAAFSGQSHVLRMPMLDKAVATLELRAWLAMLTSKMPIRHAMIEKAQVMPRQGAVSGFVYGRNYGALLTLLELQEVPFSEIRPNQWREAILGRAPKKKVSEDGETVRTSAQKKALKEISILTAKRMFPAATCGFRSLPDGVAEALLIAETARRLVLCGNILGAKAQIHG